MPFTRRHLPHWIPDDVPVFVTWRLAGSLPTPQSPDPPPSFLQHDDRLHTHHSGPTWLQNPQIASIVADALLHGETVRHSYTLHAWVVMPNHAHAIFQPHADLSTIMRWLKSRTSRKANQLLGRTGMPFWQDESFDHWVRTEELDYLIDYVESNPVKAGLVPVKAQWPWSSALGLT